MVWLSLGVALLALALGIIVLRRAPRHPAHISFGLGMAALALETALATGSSNQFLRFGALDWERARMVASALLIAPWLAFARAYSRGDAVTALPSHLRSLLALALVPPCLALVFHGGLVQLASVPNTGRLYPQLGWTGMALELFLLFGSIAILTQVERTFRGSVGIMRWRIKYMVLGVAVLFGYRLFAASQALLYQAPDAPTSRASTAALLVACILISVALARGSVFDVDVYPSQTLVYGSLTVLIAGTYLLVVGVLSHLVSRFGGDSSFPFKSLLILVALTGLAMMLLSDRFRQRLKWFVSRHLRRPVYDYRQVWNTFTTRTTSMVDEAAFCRAVTTWVSETFQSLSASVWIVDEAGDHLRLGGSTALNVAQPGSADIPQTDIKRALDALGERHEPIVIDPETTAWTGALLRLHQGVFQEGGRPVAQPLAAGGRVLGVLALGDRVGGVPFTTEELDLLRCIGDQIAASLLGLQLSAQLLRNKEMEAFQTMSAFFVHDLKNTASTLSLTLQNLHEHFSDPAFRDDALRAVGKSVQHLNGLIARLSQLRQELKVEPVPGSLLDTVQSTLAAFAPPPNLRVTLALEPVPPVLLDADQIQKVILNLLINAREALGPRGEIRVVTASDREWASVTVSDNGCGMSPEFLRRSLFRPFQTTKKNGLGIGMFQSKMIIEAHRGRMDVESTPGQGTSFRVRLPLATPIPA